MIPIGQICESHDPCRRSALPSLFAGVFDWVFQQVYIPVFHTLTLSKRTRAEKGDSIFGSPMKKRTTFYRKSVEEAGDRPAVANDG